MGNWPLTGRGEEMRRLFGLLDMRAGKPGNDAVQAGMVIAGPAGVGKTRLAREIGVAASERGWVVRFVEGTAAAQDIPLGAFAQWIERLHDQPLALVSSVISAATRSPDDAPVLIVVDDAQLLDDMSAFVLYQLIRRHAALVVATLRTGQAAPKTVTGLWKDGHLQRLDLKPLSADECTALVQAALGGPVSPQCASRLWDLTHGNVLFLHQLVRQELQAERLVRADDSGVWEWAGSITVSPSLADLVETFIGATPEPVLEVLDLLAVAEPLEIHVLDKLTDPEVVEDAERRELIKVSYGPQAGLATVGHPLYGEIRRAKIGLLRGRRLRGRVAQAIAASVSGSIGPPDPVRLGLLWLESDLSPDPGVLHRGAAAAFRRLDVSLSERLSESAIRAGAGIESHVLHARTLSLLGRADEVEQLLTALPVIERDEAWLAATTLRAMNLLLARREPENSWAVIDDALAHAPARLVQELLAFRALQLAMAARPVEVIDLAESIRLTRMMPRSRTNLNFGTTIALGQVGRIEQATQTPEDNFVLAVGSPVAAFQAIALALIHVDALVLAGCIPEAKVVAERISRQLVELPIGPRTIANAIKGVVSLATGDLPAAEESLDAALKTDDLKADPGSSAAYLGVGYWLRIAYTEALARAGRHEAADALSDMQRNRHPSFGFLETSDLLASAWAAASRDRIAEALELANQAIQVARRGGQHACEVMCLQVAIQLGDNRNHSMRLTELADLVEGPRAPLVARWAAARANHDGAALLAVSQDMEEMGDRIGAADAAAHAAEAFDRRNLRGSKLTAGARATQIKSACGASTPATNEAITSLPLSNREREIAVLLRDGMSNREIADALTMSIRTVEGHIYRACTKLGLNGKAELIDLITQFTAGNRAQSGRN